MKERPAKSFRLSLRATNGSAAISWKSGDSRKVFSGLLLMICVFAFPSVSFSYVLPKYSSSDNDRGIKTEEVLKKYETEMDLVLSDVNPTRINEYRHNKKLRLTRKEKDAFLKYEDLLTSIVFWNYVADLKKDLVALHNKKSTPEIEAEADNIAKTTIETIYKISQEYKVVMSALINNVLIKVGAKERGYCYHYVNDLRKSLSKYDLKYFDVRWGEAWGKTFRENNALVITAKDQNFNDGIAVDSWRTNGKPFWTKVRGDRFPWIELKEVVIDN